MFPAFSNVGPIYDTVSRNESSFFLDLGLVHQHEEGKRYGSGLVPVKRRNENEGYKP